jgi:hypothetical protein
MEPFLSSVCVCIIVRKYKEDKKKEFQQLLLFIYALLFTPINFYFCILSLLLLPAFLSKSKQAPLKFQSILIQTEILHFFNSPSTQFTYKLSALSFFFFFFFFFTTHKGENAHPIIDVPLLKSNLFYTKEQEQ